MAEPGLNTTIVSNRRAGVTFKVYGAILTPGSRALPLLADPVNEAALSDLWVIPQLVADEVRM